MHAEDLSELEKRRLEKVNNLRKAGQEPYPNRSQKTHTTRQAIKSFEAAEAKGDDNPIKVVLAGRLRAMRAMGKITFAHIEDRDGSVQIFLRINDLGEERMQAFSRDYDLGDFIQARGVMFRTRRGEVTLQVEDFQMLAKALLQLPAAKDEIVDGEVIRHAVLSDPETRYRQRYVDLAVNPEVREIFRIRAATLRALRKFLDDREFLEVETPILQPIYGGAAAKPFMTHHNQLHQDLYLRISFELYLKRLLVGGLERVYEIGRDFRNEGVSFKHNPEFTQLEFYMAYADFTTIMELTEQMIAFSAQEVLGSKTITFNGHDIDLTPPWRRLELRQGLLDATGIDINQYKTGESLSEAMETKGIKHKSLAKSKPGDPDTVERFEGFVGGMELCNAFTELNDPLEQERRFLEMGRTYAEDDEERHPMDEDYIRALSYGMPPAGGFGIGVDRLVMLFTGKRSIREVILFPHLRSLENE